MKVLTLIKTLEYYDVPQLLVAADATGNNYLCTLFKNDAESGYHYLGVQISESRLAAFTDGKQDVYSSRIRKNAISGYGKTRDTKPCNLYTPTRRNRRNVARGGIHILK